MSEHLDDAVYSETRKMDEDNSGLAALSTLATGMMLPLSPALLVAEGVRGAVHSVGQVVTNTTSAIQQGLTDRHQQSGVGHG